MIILGKQEMNEPLQRFGEAKKWMAGIYDELNEYVNELYAFYLSMHPHLFLVLYLNIFRFE